ncbi:hypothetical protein DUNSADRAFT_6380 [Dunaliella salina]|uniref:Uncharacterized protein n=1 Tax=Dunaliella salina TaxID=3046 RepID=A0ABQ7GND7_DUNSA|nr:hypothetical protein DUNSADRAFT_6380 [Dunaliella salina]|eukprot:KAF5836127.1 hypothetical protein DUNSADRAFT_6380 [Dunaliella salina]
MEYTAATLAVWQSGGIVVPLGTSLPPTELSYLFQDAGINLVLVTRDAAGRMEDIASANGAEIHVLDPSFLSTAQQPWLQPSTDLFSPSTNGHPQHQHQPHQQLHQIQDPSQQPGSMQHIPFPNKPFVSSSARDHEQGALIIYTSGTTGKPKGVLHTHRSLSAQVDSLCTAWEWGPEDTILHPLPLHHIHGIVNALYCPLYAGARVEFLPKFVPMAVWDRIMKGGISVFMGVPTMYAKLLAAYDAMPPAQQKAAAEAAASLRLTVSGSSACPVPIMYRWKQLTGKYLLERYGMTETGMALSNPYRGHRQPGSVGMPLPHVDVRIAADGELRVRGPTLFSCYWGRPEATAQAFDEEGYFLTGDTAACSFVSTDIGEQVGPHNSDLGSPVADKNAGLPADANQKTQNSLHDPGSSNFRASSGEAGRHEGTATAQKAPYFSILGRTSVDIIKSSGYKVSALQVESILMAHPSVSETAVLGVPDPVHGEVITALVCPDPAAPTHVLHRDLQQALHQHCLVHLAPYQSPRRFIILDAPLPRNPMGKINKKELLQLFFGKELERAACDAVSPR